jgi:hypothetical protein
MIWALLGAYLTKRPPWLQAVVFGLSVGLFVAAGLQANTRDPRVSSVLLQVLVVAVTTGGGFYLPLRAEVRRQPGNSPPTWVHVAYAGAWLLAIAAAVRALLGAGGLKVAVLAIVPIILLAPPAFAGIRALPHRQHREPDGAPTAAHSPQPPS